MHGTVLIADGGSTKTNWCLSVEGKSLRRFTTEGVNPFFRGTQPLIEEWKGSPLAELSGKVDFIWFYGAGITDRERAGVIEKALSALFVDAGIEVASDLLAAARATLGRSAGIASILGTGSNSCLYDGSEIIAHVPPLGYLLGDEGSGAFLGRCLVSDYLKGIMPEILRKKFENQFPITYPEVLHRVYRGENPNRFLAAFTPFLTDQISHRYCIDIVEKAFDLFVERNIMQYKGFREVPLTFTGSVAYHFREQLNSVLLRRGLASDIVMSDPMDGLMTYHFSR